MEIEKKETQNQQTKQLKNLVKNGNLIANNTAMLKEVIMVLNKTDKKTDKDIMGVKKILQKVNFDAVIGRGPDERIGEEEIQELAQYMKY